MRKDIHKFCRSCGTYQTTKKSTRRNPGLLHPLPTLDTPWLSISMDFTGPFPTSLGYDYLWVIICRLTSNIHLVISMYFHPHSTHSAPPLDTPGALQYHPGDHPHFLSLCHPPDILVSNPCLNSSDLGTSGPRDLWTLESHWHFR